MSSDAAAFKWEDPFHLEAQLTEDERLIRDSAQDYAQDKLLPRIVEAYEKETVEPEIFREMGALGLLGVTLPEKYGCAGANYVSYGLGGARGGARRFRLSLDDERAILARHVSDLRLWRRGPAREISAEAGERRMDRLFRADRSRGRLRSRLDEDEGRADRRRLSPDRLQTLDLQRADRRRLRDLGEILGAWRPNPRLHPGKGHEGPFGAEDRGQAVAARLDHRRNRHGGRRGLRRASCCPMSPA